MKKTIFTSIIAFILVIFLVSCGGWTVEIKEPEEFSASFESESDTDVPENSETAAQVEKAIEETGFEGAWIRR